LGKGRKKKIVLWILGIIIFAVLSGSAYVYLQLNKINKVEIPKTDSELDISNEASKLDSQVTNIALLGTDSRNAADAGHSDSIMILSIDKIHNKLKISSIMRDTYVNLEGHGMNIITEAYHYGGAALSVKTLNSTFDLNIKNYVTVDFDGLQNIIDSIGGIQLNIKSSEIPYINKCIDDIAKLNKVSVKHIRTGGKQQLNGAQALAYTRERATGSGDFDRTERQRIMLTAVIEKIKARGVTKLPSTVSTVLPYTTTNMGQASIMSLGTLIFTSNMTTIDQVRFPVDGYYQATPINGQDPIEADLVALKDQIHKYIYDDQKPVAK
jgi:LCP family protein required for cell wall assembly